MLAVLLGMVVATVGWLAFHHGPAPTVSDERGSSTGPSRVADVVSPVPKTFDSQGIFFSYESSWSLEIISFVPVGPAGDGGGITQPGWFVMVNDATSGDSITVEPLTGTDPEDAAGRAAVVSADVTRAAEDGGGGPGPVRLIPGTPSPTYSFSVLDETSEQGKPTFAAGYVVFGHRIRYVITCKSSASDDVVTDTCAKLLRSFRITAPGLSPRTPTIASVSKVVYEAWKDGDLDAAASVSTLAARQALADSTWKPGMGSPSDCFPLASPPPEFQCAAVHDGRVGQAFLLRMVKRQWTVVGTRECSGTPEQYTCSSVRPFGSNPSASQ
jgi:hypothetical protein